MRFSQRIGKKDVRQSLQIENIDNILENKLWNNILTDFIEKISDNSSRYEESDKVIFLKILWQDFFERKIDEISSYSNGGVYSTGVVEFIRKWYLEAEWYEKYDLIEYLSEIDKKINFDFTEKVNTVLKSQLAGYTLINNKIVQINSEQEIQSIEEALSKTSKYKSVETHLVRALELLSDRENPDFRNSIKESISAVEAYCVILTGDKKATLGKALSAIEKKYKLHSALKSAFSALYGYTSDSGGIRHALLEDDVTITVEDAKFMLVSCSAFINFLMNKEEKNVR